MGSPHHRINLLSIPSLQNTQKTQYYKRLVISDLQIT